MSATTSKKNVEAIYGLSPLQQAMLAHTLLDTETGTYTSQQVFELSGHLDMEAFRQAWATIVERHTIFRTIFLRLDTPQPLQIVRHEVPLPWTFIDLDDSDADHCRFEELMESDRRRGFPTDKAPLMRLTLVSLGDDRHRFIWSRHHAITDGWSTAVVMSEFLVLYNGSIRGRAPTLPSPRPYRDYIRYLASRDLEEAAAFWRDYLKGIETATPLGIDVPRGAGDTAQKTLALHFTAAETAGLERFARETATTLNILVQGVWSLLLRLYSGEDTVLFGATVSGRPADLAGVENMAGPFINSLPVVVPWTPSVSVASWLKRLHADQANRIRFDFTPLVQIQNQSEIPSDRPLFQSLVVFENYPMDQTMIHRLDGLQLSLYRSTSPNNLPLTLRAMKRENLLDIEVIYETGRFPRRHMDCLLEQFQRVAMAFIADPDRLVDVGMALSATELEGMVMGTVETVPRPTTCVHEMVARFARDEPDKTAVLLGTEQLSYAALDRQSDECARVLMARGVGRETLVGLCADRSPRMFISLLGILKAGAAYVPLAVDYPRGRIEALARNASMDLVLAEAGQVARLSGYGLETLSIDTDWAAGQSETGPLPIVDPHQLVYVIFTSGSTGEPKGVGVAHLALANYIQAVCERLALSPRASLTALATVAADLANTAVFGALGSGRTLRLFPEAFSLDPERLARELETEPVSCMKLVPAHLRTLLANRRPQRLLPMECLVLGGEALDTALVARVRELAPACRIVNHYGPTEATVGALTHEIPSQDVTRPGSIPIGRALANYRAYVVDRQLTPLPAMAVGELLLGGVSLARGYLNRPALTAQKFVPDPFAREPGARAYLSGDRARCTPDGDILFLGRVDHQVKIRGFRIEPGEIQAVLERFEEVHDAIVLVKDDRGDKKLVAYVVPADGSAVSGDVLADRLGACLPSYMVPAEFICLDAIPLTPNGKVDRRALLQSAGPKKGNQPDGPDEPRDEYERFQATLWREVLQLDRVGLDDNFFALGGHSLLATLVVVRTRDRYDIDLDIGAFVANPTILGVVELVKQLHAGSKRAVPPVVPVPRDRIMPLSHAQQRLWFLDQLEEGRDNYNVTGALSLTGTLDAQLLRQCLATIMERHEVLRTRFVQTDGVAGQEILAEVALPFTTRSIAAEDVADLIGSFANQRFDLGSAPLWRVVLARIDDGRHILVLVMHHIISDRWSMGVLVKEVATLYDAGVTGLPRTLPPLTVQYADFAHWQHHHLSGAPLQNELTYWKEALADIPARIDLPTDRPHPSVQSYQGADEPLLISAELTQTLQEFGRGENATLFMTLLAALDVLLFRYSGERDVVIGSPIANRSRSELEPLIGFFVNTIVQRARLRPGMSFRELLSQVSENAVAGYAHQDVPFELIVEALQPDRSLSHAPLFQVMLVFQNTPLTPLSAKGLEIEPLSQPGGVAKFDLTFILTESERGMEGMVQYSTDLFDRATIRSMIAHFTTLLSAATTVPDKAVASLPMMSAAERQTILKELCRSGNQAVPTRCAHHYFEAAARQNPTKTAVAMGDTCLDFAALDRAANRLAHELMRRGVRSGARLGLCMERSLNLAVGILAIHKVGGVYLPIDPAYPPARIAFVIENAQIAMMLTLAAHAAFLQEFATPLLCLDRLDDSGKDLPDTSPERPVSPGDSAYIMYTSGSTGNPKGVVVSHHNLAVSTQARIDYYGSLAECFLLLSSHAFDSSIAGIFGSLCGGNTLVIGDPRQEPEAILALIERWRVTMTLCLPSLYYALLDLVTPGNWPLQAVVVAGEACTRKVLEKHRERAPQTTVFNEYGPTEGSVWCTLWRWNGVLFSGSVPIGRTIDGYRLYVADEAGELIPRGIAGELLIGGPGVARGYLGLPEITAERFIPDSFGEETGLRLYRTGDKVRLRRDGQLAFLGRMDHQVKIRGFRVELGEVETALGAYPQVRECAVLIRESEGPQRLVGFFSGETEAPDLTENLIRFLGRKLPDYMVPTLLVPMDRLPVNANGKIDRKALASYPLPDNRSQRGSDDLPRNQVERELVAIWRRLLDLDQVGIHDNFFKIGGDSIVSIQVIAQANRLGYGLAPKHLFKHQTIAGLAAFAKSAANVLVPQEPVTGPVPLTPIQHWFFDLGLAHQHHWNQAVLLTLPASLDPDALEAALGLLLDHHDALRARFGPADGVWAQHYEPPGRPPTLAHVDLSDQDEDAMDSALSAEMERIQGSIDLTGGLPLRLTRFDLGCQGQRLLIAIHHLVIDGVSWRILLEDLENAYQALVASMKPDLPPRTTSVATWVNKLTKHAPSVAASELDWWRNLTRGPWPGLPVDKSAENLVDHERSLSRCLDDEATRELLQHVPTLYNTDINDVLLACLLTAIAAWTGSSAILISLEGHGREDLFDDVDLSRTVGWFTSEYPVVLKTPTVEGVGALLKAVKEQLRAIPGKGLGFGILRYLSDDPEVAEIMEQAPRADISFNYLGRFDAGPASQTFHPSAEKIAANRAIGQQRPYLINMTGMVGRQGSLEVTWAYNDRIHEAATIAGLADDFMACLQGILAHARAPRAGGFTPSDHPRAGLTQGDLDELVAAVCAEGDHRLIASVYPLSNQQHGLLFHTLTEPSSDVFLWQLACELLGLDVAAFKQAWARIVARHDVFRTLFWKVRSETPLQVVLREVGLPWVEEDWRGLAEDERERRFRELLDHPSTRTFDFSRAPILRLCLIRTGETTYRFIWSQHHALSDGWSQPIVFRELLEAYQAFGAGSDWQRPQPRPYRDYIYWLLDQDSIQAEGFWRQHLAGIHEATALNPPQNDLSSAGGAEFSTRTHLPETLTASLENLVREHGLTLNVVVQGLWSILLGRYTGKEDVIYGTISSGRPGDLVGVEDMVGLFVWALPVRVRILPLAPALAWLADCMEDQVQREQHGFLPLARIQRCSNIPRGAPLFRLLVQSQNYPMSDLAASAGLDIRILDTFEKNNYPFTMKIIRGKKLVLEITHDPAHFGTDAIRVVLAHLQSLIQDLVAHPTKTVGALAMLTDEEREQRDLKLAKLHKHRKTSLRGKRRSPVRALPED